MKDIPADSLIKNYFPVDYIDSFSKVMVTGQALTPEDFRNLAFSRFPKWIGWLMNFRNAIVKPLGLDTATRFTDMVLDKNLHEEILGMPDKHLDFHVSMWCGEYHEGKQELRITTVVKYNNWLGRAYFFIIRPLHGITPRTSSCPLRTLRDRALRSTSTTKIPRCRWRAQPLKSAATVRYLQP